MGTAKPDEESESVESDVDSEVDGGSAAILGMRRATSTTALGGMSACLSRYCLI